MPLRAAYLCPHGMQLLTQLDPHPDPYGYSPHAKRFDELINQWIKAKNSEQRKFLWEKAFALAEHAKACGLATLSVLNGVFHASTDMDKQKPGFWKGHLYGYAVPTYFGMSLARFSPQ